MSKLCYLSLLSVSAALLAGLSFYLGSATAQQAFDPAPVAAVCAYSSSPPTATSGTFIFAQCDSAGKLQVH